MRSLVLDVDDTIYEKLVNFLGILPKNKIKVVEDIHCSKRLEKELIERKREISRGETLGHDEFWESAGV